MLLEELKANYTAVTDTSIGEGALAGINIVSITIPYGVTSIDNYAFYGCPKLTIYCSATSQPKGWSIDWNPDNLEVKWDK